MRYFIVLLAGAGTLALLGLGLLAPPTLQAAAPIGGLTPTVTPCTLTFSDVPPGQPYYPYIRCLACRGIVSGYADGTFRPYNAVTIGQQIKMISNTAGWTDPIPADRQTFGDVPPGQPYWVFVERAVVHGLLCPNGNCGPPDCNGRPCLRPDRVATRNKTAQLIALAAGYSDPLPSATQTFADVPPSDPYSVYIERLVLHEVISGYTCGGPNEPCLPPNNRPYFRPNSQVVRGQMAKFLANAFYPNCQTPQAR